ncbi:MAG: PQQ-binding-like beta-propeller repeat protein [Verrucomicrobiota bacterium]|nr:PQQ-binding-like beta-propeller repeat protein [Verrucomicrobiota bacterium]
MINVLSTLLTWLLVFGMGSVVAHTAEEENEWTRFRGPNGSGISGAKTIPIRWIAKDYNWTVILPGDGSSSPVVWGQHLFVTCNDRKKSIRSIVCVNATDGKIRWRRNFPYTSYRMHRDNDFASATPTVDAGGVVVVWSMPKQLLMLALDLEGKELWRRDLGPYVGIHGSASSPIIANDLVVLANDQMHPQVMKRYLPKGASMVPGESFLIAVDRKSGKTCWKIERKTVLAGYSTPCVRQTGRGTELVFSGTAHGMTGVGLKTGKVNWEIKGILGSRVVGSPQLYQDLVFGSHGVGLSAQRFVAVRAPKEGGAAKPEVAYNVYQSPPLVPSCLIKDDLLFLWTDSGIVSCLDAASGKRYWRERVGGSYYCSPVWIEGRLYCTSKTGEVVVVAAKKTFKLLAKNPLGEKCFAVPAVANGVMYQRTQTKLFSLGGKNKK